MAAGAATPPTAAEQGILADNSASPISPMHNASTEDIRTWAIKMFNEHEDILKRLVNKANADRTASEGESMALGAQVRALETSVTELNNAVVRADGQLRAEIMEFSVKLAASEGHVKGVSNQFAEHVAGAFAAVSIELQQWRQQVSASTAAPTSSGPAASGDFMASVLTSQGSDILKTEELLVKLQSEHVKLETIVAAIAQKSCHCPHLDELAAVSKVHDETLREDHATLSEATTRIQGVELAVLQLQGVGGTMRAPPTSAAAPDTLPDPWANAAGLAAGMPTTRPPGVEVPPNKEVPSHRELREAL